MFHSSKKHAYISRDNENFPNYFHMDAKALLKRKTERDRRLRRCAEPVPRKFSICSCLLWNQTGLNKSCPKPVSHYSWVSHMAVNFCNLQSKLLKISFHSSFCSRTQIRRMGLSQDRSHFFFLWMKTRLWGIDIPLKCVFSTKNSWLKKYYRFFLFNLES